MEIAYTLENIKDVANSIIKNSAHKTLLFNGEMGTGKTTLIKAIVKQLGSSDEVSSPTYSIVNEYKTETLSIFHFDLYRINSIEEVYDFGFEDYLNLDSWLFIEWPELVKDEFFNENFHELHILKSDRSKRILNFK